MQEVLYLMLPLIVTIVLLIVIDGAWGAIGWLSRILQEAFESFF